MMKNKVYIKFLKIIISNLFFLSIIFNQSAYSKPIPPGSGEGDVPANILILLDSLSFGWKLKSAWIFKNPPFLISCIPPPEKYGSAIKLSSIPVIFWIKLINLNELRKFKKPFNEGMLSKASGEDVEIFFYFK